MSFKATLEPDLTGPEILAHKVSVQLVGGKIIPDKHGKKDNWWGLICIYICGPLKVNICWKILTSGRFIFSQKCILFFFVTVFFKQNLTVFNC